MPKASESKTAALNPGATAAGKFFAGGSFWKRFSALKDGVATGYVVNYELSALPGLALRLRRGSFAESRLALSSQALRWRSRSRR